MLKGHLQRNRGVMRSRRLLALLAVVTGLSLGSASAQLVYPQVIRMKYEAVNPAGGGFVIWLDRERIYYGGDPRFPHVQSVEFTYVTPSPGSPVITTIEVLPMNSSTPDVFHVAGVVRVRVVGMALKSTNAGH
jgi:hypothetical protein